MSGGEQTSSRGALFGGGAAVLAALCCFAGPAFLGAVAGATIGSTLGVVAAVICAAAVAVVVALLLRRRQGKGRRDAEPALPAGGDHRPRHRPVRDRHQHRAL